MLEKKGMIDNYRLNLIHLHFSDKRVKYMLSGVIMLFAWPTENKILLAWDHESVVLVIMSIFGDFVRLVSKSRLHFLKL